MRTLRRDNRIWLPEAEALARRRYEIDNAPLPAIVDELQSPMPGVTLVQLTNQAKRMGWKRSTPGRVLASNEQERLFARVLVRRPAEERVVRVERGTHKAAGYSMIGGRLHG